MTCSCTSVAAAHDHRHRRPERLFAADRQHRHGQLATGDKSLVVDGVLVEGRELAETGAHCARLCVQPGIMFARGLAKRPRIGRKLVPEAIEVDAFATGNQALHVRATKAEMPQ
jgi:hypothetical protein